MMESQSTGEVLGLFFILCIFAWAAVVIAKWVFLSLKDGCRWLFEILTRVHWRLHRRFFPNGYFVGVDVGIGADHTAMVLCRREHDGTVTVLDFKVFPRKSL